VLSPTARDDPWTTRTPEALMVLPPDPALPRPPAEPGPDIPQPQVPEPSSPPFEPPPPGPEPLPAPQQVSP